MRVPYRWLGEYVEVPWDPHALAERLTMLGVKVEAVHDAALEVENVVVGRIVALAPHPRTSALLVARVDVGGSELQMVTGAPNARVGDLVAAAVPGARLPGGRTIEAAPVRGVMSSGMLLSATELLFGEPHAEGEGLLVLEGDLRPGQLVARAMGLDDTVLELELTPNYAHCLSLVGVAQEVAALTGGKVHWPEQAADPVALPERQWPLPIDIQAQDLCSRYVGKLVGGIQVGHSPLWLQRRLQLAGMRPISNVVDVTNYVMLELGQPLHAFDYRLLAGPGIVVRRGIPGETMVTLDGKERNLSDDMLVIADARGAVAIAGVMGGMDTEVSMATSEVLLESAYFDPVSIRKTAGMLGLRSEASARFERGIDPTGQARAAERAAHLLQRLAGACPAGGVADRWPVRFQPLTIQLRPDRLRALLGLAISDTDIAASLARFGFGVERRGHAMAVAVPPRRNDVAGEVDLAEEVARLYGYERIPTTLLRGTTPGRRTDRQLRVEAVRQLLLGCGVDEALTSSLTRPGEADRFDLPPDDARRRVVELANPLTEEESVLRGMLVSTLLEALAHNRRRQIPSARLFEMGRVFQSRGPDVLPQETLHLAVAAYGPTRDQHWGARALVADFYYVKGLAQALWERLGLPELEANPGYEPWLHPGRQAVLLARGRPVGVAGELHPGVAGRFDVPAGTVALELDLDALLDLVEPVARYRPLPRYPAATRDLAVVVPETVPAAAVLAAIRRAGGENLESVRLFDVYQGEQVPAGHRSLACALTFRSALGTLNDEQVETRQDLIRTALREELGATFR